LLGEKMKMKTKMKVKTKMKTKMKAKMKTEMKVKAKSKTFALILAALAISFTFSFTFSIIPSISFAAINCQGSCFVNDCNCIIGECSSGIFDVYESSTCSGNPILEHTFAARNAYWAPPKTGTFYVQALCDDGLTKTACTAASVRTAGATTATTTEAITTSTAPTGGGGDNTIWIIVAILVIVGVIGFLLYRFFFAKGKKGAKATYEELYRKWGSRTR